MWLSYVSMNCTKSTVRVIVTPLEVRFYTWKRTGSVASTNDSGEVWGHSICITLQPILQQCFSIGKESVLAWHLPLGYLSCVPNGIQVRVCALKPISSSHSLSLRLGRIQFEWLFFVYSTCRTWEAYAQSIAPHNRMRSVSTIERLYGFTVIIVGLNYFQAHHQLWCWYAVYWRGANGPTSVVWSFRLRAYGIS